MNGIEEYRRLIQELCEFTGISHWEEVADAQHIEVDGTTVGMLVEQAPDTCRLCLYFDLGIEGHSDIYRGMLEANLAIDPEETGYFGSHPESGAIVYRVNLPLTEDISGMELALRIQDSLHAGRGKLAQLRTGRSLPLNAIDKADGTLLAI
ncbi:MAG: HpaB protein [Noviherbaspirillum sp.]|nr:HpaB protein [Noviherbaspirillum sp.]